MASVNLNKWVVSGNLAADVETKTVTLRSGEEAEVASGTLYVQRGRNREESFTVSLSIWQKSNAWRLLPYLKRGSLIICTGNVDVNPFISKNGNVPRAGLEMTVLDIDLVSVRNSESSVSNSASGAEPVLDTPTASEDKLLVAAFPTEF
ncbi:single-stranded DNA-binding protein [Egbenema bharatensis]|uniref:single-stranded DNA-binding protein n=1 Tax=Egbenema bharatensis TaxID=3463334 RepID=UPI003A847ECC